MNTEIFFDCGAPSLYNRLSKQKKNKVMGTHMKHRRRDKFDYTQTEEYLAYRDRYAEFIRENMHILSAYPNLDVINNAELTYENQKYLESKGIHPCPVWHLGEDVRWLRKYLEEGYPYICLGGMVPNHVRSLRPVLDRLWINELTDKDGMPLVKVHGFALTSFHLMYRYPWYSVDSKSWIDYAKFGRILVPKPTKEGKNWLQPFKVAVTKRSLDKTTLRTGHHFKGKTPREQRYIQDHIKALGLAWGESSFKKVKKGYKPKQGKELWYIEDEVIEIIEVNGVTNCRIHRLDCNIYAFRMIEKTVPPWPWSIKETVREDKVKGLFA